MRRIAVLGLGSFGYHLACVLGDLGTDVLAVDNKIERVESIKDKVSRAICLDTTKEENLARISLDEMDAVIVALGESSIESSILTTALIAKMDIPMIISRSTTELHGRILKMVGAKEIINPEEDVAKRVAQRVAEPGILDLLSISKDGFAISELVTPAQFVGKSLADLNLRGKYGLNVVAIKRICHDDGTEDEDESCKNHETINHNPGPDALLEEGDILVCLGKVDNIETLAQMES